MLDVDGTKTELTAAVPQTAEAVAWAWTAEKQEPPKSDTDELHSSELAEIIGWQAVSPNITQSMMKYNCPRKYLLRQRYRLRRKGPLPAQALEVGQFTHLIAGGRVSGWTAEASAANAFKHLDAVTAKLQAAEDKGEVRPGTTAAKYDEMLRWLNLARAMTDIFFQKYKLNPATKVFAVEHRVIAQVEGIKTPVQGDLDLLVDVPDGPMAGLWIVDWKTTKKNATVRAMSTPFALQKRIYRLLAAAGWPDKTVRGFIWGIMEKCPLQFGQLDRDFTEAEHVLKSGPRKGETELRRTYEGLPKYENYLRRVSEWYAAREQTTWDPIASPREGPAMLQVWAEFNEPLLTRELFNQLWRAGKMSTALPVLSNFPRNDESCVHYETACEFLPLCASSPQVWGPEIAANYERVPDDEK